MVDIIFIKSLTCTFTSGNEFRIDFDSMTDGF